MAGGAALDSRNEDGQFPLLVASRRGHLDVVQLLIQGGAAVDFPDREDRTTLDVALKYDIKTSCDC
jgi:ankyrin repeat protein